MTTNAVAAAASPTITKTPVTAPLFWKKLYVTYGIANVRRERGRDADGTYDEPLP